MTDAYAAGLVDGEGCITIPHQREVYSIRVDIGMTTRARPVLNWMQSVYGGAVRRTRPATDRWEEAICWTVTGSEAASFLRRINPHLRLKQDQSAAALKVEEIRLSLEPFGRGRRWTTEARERCAVLRQRVQELNRKGPIFQASDGTSTPVARLVAGQWVTDQGDLFSDLGLTSFSGTLPASGSMRSGALYERRRSALPTSATDSSSSPLLPTPRTSDTNGAGMHGTGGPDLRTTVSLLPTPRASDGEKGGPNQRGSKGDLALPAAVVQLLPTPNASDFKGSGATQGRTRNGRPRPLSDADLPETVALLSSTGADSAPPSAAGKPSPDDGPLGQLTIEIG